MSNENEEPVEYNAPNEEMIVGISQRVANKIARDTNTQNSIVTLSELLSTTVETSQFAGAEPTKNTVWTEKEWTAIKRKIMELVNKL